MRTRSQMLSLSFVAVIVSVVMIAGSVTAEVCDGEWHGPTVGQTGIHGSKHYLAVYQDPEETGCTDTYPFRVESVIWRIRNNLPTPVTITVQPLIFAAELSDPGCPVPGVLLKRGPANQVDIGPNGDENELILPVGGCCVDGPYFAVVELFDDWTHLMLLDVDDGVSPPVRTCANYINEGDWLDVAPYIPGNVKLWSVGETDNDCDGCASYIEAGVDLWISWLDGLLIDEYTFADDPIPADFFGPGSDPFDGQIAMVGEPLTTWPSGALGEADAVIERLNPLELPTVGSADDTDIRMVALNLVSDDPITVTYNGGMSPENWDFRVCLSDVAQPIGGMLLDRTCCRGGIFMADLPILPKFVFTRQSDMMEMTLDFGFAGFPLQFYSTSAGSWMTVADPQFWHSPSTGFTSFIDECSPAMVEDTIPPSTDFLRCENRLGDFSDCFFPDPCLLVTCCLPPGTGDLDQSQEESPYHVSGIDLSVMIDGLFIGLDWSAVCLDEADVDYSCARPCNDTFSIDGIDLSVLIDALFISLTPPPLCDGTPY